MTDGNNVAQLTTEPRKLYWNDREVEPREVSVEIGNVARRHARTGDGETSLYTWLVHSLHYVGTQERVFDTVDQLVKKTPNRQLYKLMNLAIECQTFNEAPDSDMNPEFRRRLEAAGPK